MLSGSSRRKVVSRRIVPRSLSPLKKLDVNRPARENAPTSQLAPSDDDPGAAVEAQVVVEEAAGRVGDRDAVLLRRATRGAGEQLRRKVEREGELRRIQLVARARGSRRRASAGRKSPAGSASRSRCPTRASRGSAMYSGPSGATKRTPIHFALLAVDDRLDQQRRHRGCALDAGLACRRLGLRGRRRGSDDCRRQGYAGRTQLQRLTSAVKLPRSVTTFSFSGPSAWIFSGYSPVSVLPTST